MIEIVKLEEGDVLLIQARVATDAAAAKGKQLFTDAGIPSIIVSGQDFEISVLRPAKP